MLRFILVYILIMVLLTRYTWKVSKFGVFPGPYFTVFGLNIEKYKVSHCIQFKYGNLLTRKNSEF